MQSSTQTWINLEGQCILWFLAIFTSFGRMTSLLTTSTSTGIDTYMDVVARANKNTGQNIELLVEGLAAPRGLLRISARDRSPGTGDFYIVRSAL